MNVRLFIALALLLACHTGPEVDASALTRVQTIMHHRGEPFTGAAVSLRGALLVSRTEYRDGLKDGLEQAWYENGQLQLTRRYERGLRVGEHRSYWPNGALKSVTHYDADLFEGEQRWFFPNGRPAELQHYHEGQEEGLQRAWNEQGDIVSNYVFKKGRRYGIVGRFDCVSVARRSEP